MVMGTHQLSSSSPAPTQSLIIEGTCIGTANFLTENSLVTTPFYILLNKSATLLDITFERRKFHCCNNQKTIIFTSVCIFLEWYNCCQKKKIYTSKKPT